MVAYISSNDKDSDGTFALGGEHVPTISGDIPVFLSFDVLVAKCQVACTHRSEDVLAPPSPPSSFLARSKEFTFASLLR